MLYNESLQDCILQLSIINDSKRRLFIYKSGQAFLLITLKKGGQKDEENLPAYEASQKDGARIP